MHWSPAAPRIANAHSMLFAAQALAQRGHQPAALPPQSQPRGVAGAVAALAAYACAARAGAHGRGVSTRRWRRQVRAVMLRRRVACLHGPRASRHCRLTVPKVPHYIHPTVCLVRGTEKGGHAWAGTSQWNGKGMSAGKALRRPALRVDGCLFEAGARFEPTFEAD